MTTPQRDADTHTTRRTGPAVPGTRHRPTELLRTMLEERLQTHISWLTDLANDGAQPEITGDDRDVLDALVAAARQCVADTTQALQRISNGTYGVCEACGEDIPLGRLRSQPQARFCVPCQRRARSRALWPASAAPSSPVRPHSNPASPGPATPHCHATPAACRPTRER
jgi:DnaK suppressor protein